jgi:hypothetical protein
LIYGSALASFCVEKFGTENILDIDANKLRDRVSDFRRLSYVDFLTD